MNMLKTAVLTLLLLLAVLSVYAEPQLSVAAVDSISIPYPYDYSMMLPNGDIQFYEVTYGSSSLQISAFQYNSQTNQITPPLDVGTISGLDGITSYWRYWKYQFNRFYIVHQLTSGISIIMLNQGLITSRIVSDISLDQFFDFRSMTDIVAVDAIAIASTDSLVYYNFNIDTYQTLLHGQEYSITWGGKRVLALPENRFIYVQDATSGAIDAIETWTIFDSEGNYLFTQTYTNDIMTRSILGPLVGEEKLVHGRFYLSHFILDDGGNLECHFVEPDSLHLYNFYSPYSEYDNARGFYPFDNDKTMELCFDSAIEQYYMYCYNSPLELYHVPTYTFSFGMHQPMVNCISSDIVTMSARLTQSIAIAALWTHDYPNVHEFYFPASSNAPTSCVTYNYDNSLYIINNSKVYRFNVGVSSSSNDVLAVIPESDLQVYPNPVRMDQSLTIRSQSKQPTKIDIYNIKGQRVQSLQMDESGQLDWNLSSSTNPKLSTGVYFIKQRDANHSKPKRFVLIK